MPNLINKTFAGFVFKAPAHTNPAADPNLYGFSGVSSSGETLKSRFSVIHVPGSVTPEEFAADVAACPQLHGHMTTLAPLFDFGRFRYHRPGDGSEASAEADDIRSITMKPPGQTRAPDPAPQPAPAPRPAPRRTPPPSPGMDLSF